MIRLPEKRSWRDVSSLSTPGRDGAAGTPEVCGEPGLGRRDPRKQGGGGSVRVAPGSADFGALEAGLQLPTGPLRSDEPAGRGNPASSVPF